MTSIASLLSPSRGCFFVHFLLAYSSPLHLYILKTNATCGAGAVMASLLTCQRCTCNLTDPLKGAVWGLRGAVQL